MAFSRTSLTGSSTNSTSGCIALPSFIAVYFPFVVIVILLKLKERMIKSDGQALTIYSMSFIKYIVSLNSVERFQKCCTDKKTVFKKRSTCILKQSYVPLKALKQSYMCMSL